MNYHFIAESFETSVPWSNVLLVCERVKKRVCVCVCVCMHVYIYIYIYIVSACVSGGGDALLAGADENSWQSRPRHARASSAFTSSVHTPSSRLHAPCAIQQQATVMVLLDASVIARNVGRDLVFAASRRAACSHSDLSCANYGAEALPA